MSLRELIDGNLAAQRQYDIEQSRAQSEDFFIGRCKAEIIEDISKGLPLQCNGYVITPSDFVYDAGCHGDSDTMQLAFMAGHVSETDYRKWLHARLEEYADKHAIARAEYLKQ